MHRDSYVARGEGQSALVKKAWHLDKRYSQGPGPLPMDSHHCKVLWVFLTISPFRECGQRSHFWVLYTFSMVCTQTCELRFELQSNGTFLLREQETLLHHQLRDIDLAEENTFLFQSKCKHYSFSPCSQLFIVEYYRTVCTDILE
jgi:hypothetical protein